MLTEMVTMVEYFTYTNVQVWRLCCGRGRVKWQTGGPKGFYRALESMNNVE